MFQLCLLKGCGRAEMERKGVKPSKGELRRRREAIRHVSRDWIYNIRMLWRLAEAKALLDGILSNGMKPNRRTYRHLINGFCRQGELDEAKDLYDEMVGKGLRAEAECFFTLVHFLCQGKDFEGALRICDDCISNGWFPNVTTMSTLVRGLASTNKLDEARRII